MYWETRHISNDLNCHSNRIFNIPLLSSDICMWDNPTQEISGTTTINNVEVICDLTNVNLLEELNIIKNECVSYNDDCFSLAKWKVNINIDGEIYEENIRNTNSPNTTPNKREFFNVINRILNNNDINYKENDGYYKLYKTNGISLIEIFLCIDIDLNNNQFCPEGFNPTPFDDACVKYTTTATTLNGNLLTAYTGSYDIENNFNGGQLFTGLSYPVGIVGSSDTVYDLSGNTITPIYTNPSTPFYHRLNEVGIWSFGNSEEWYGLDYCLELEEPTTYYLGISAKRKSILKVNGELVFTSEPSDSSNGRDYSYWKIFEYNFYSGKNIIEVEGWSETTGGTLGFEIYSGNPTSIITSPNESTLESYTIFSTKELITSGGTPNGYFTINSENGYSCPTGYALDTCSGSPVCTKIEYIEQSGCTGTCEEKCILECEKEFNVITNNSEGVYIINEDTNIDLSFNFSGLTELETQEPTYRFEVSKYNKFMDSFEVPSLYISDDYSLDEMVSGFNITLNSNILNPDGEYVIKPYFSFDSCTTFLNKMGKRIDQRTLSNGGGTIANNINNPYFIIMNGAEIPTFNGGNDLSEPTTINVLDTEVIFPEFDGQTNISPSNNNFNGARLVTLNGSSLSQGYDWFPSGSQITFAGELKTSDIITITQVPTGDIVNNNGLTVENILVTEPIVSGPLDGEGNNKIYYNTTKDKYEIYLNNNFLDNNILLSLNGLSLTNNVDYYVSSSNQRRIILEGNLKEGDILVVTYSTQSGVDNILENTNTLRISWSIQTPPQFNDSYFDLEFTTNDDPNFENIITSVRIPYVVNQTSYEDTVEFNGLYNDEYFYRVKNTKNYKIIGGDLISDVKYSEVIKITIKNNLNNVY